MSIRKIRAKAYARWRPSLVEVLSAKLSGKWGQRIADAICAPNPFLRLFRERK